MFCSASKWRSKNRIKREVGATRQKNKVSKSLYNTPITASLSACSSRRLGFFHFHASATHIHSKTLQPLKSSEARKGNINGGYLHSHLLMVAGFKTEGAFMPLRKGDEVRRSGLMKTLLLLAVLYTAGGSFREQMVIG